ncbi:MAG TPA: AraC family transcriptional regulator, partial [Caulobacteraceae bacterium]|nr:AraC family transcriptional regulator [Caulobacteraceae bacterium]
MAHRLGLLIFPDFQILDAAGPIAAFEIAGRYGQGAYAIETLALDGGAMRSSSGVTLGASVADAGVAFDTLMIAGGDGARGASHDLATLDFVRRAAARSGRVASVCSGAFVLAAAGLLDGRRATTHWSRTDDFARRFPQVRMEPDRIFVRDGRVWTSAGITAGIDLSLAMIAEDLGEEIARRTARQLVVYRRRPGGQSQYSALLELERPESRFGALLVWARERLAEPLG